MSKEPDFHFELPVANNWPGAISQLGCFLLIVIIATLLGVCSGELRVQCGSVTLEKPEQIETVKEP